MARTEVPAALAELGITQADIDAAMADDQVDHGLNDLANKVCDYAQSISPVGTAEEGDKNPGEYRDAWHVERHDGEFRVINDDFKAYWVEFGSVHMPEYAVGQRTAEHFGGEVRLAGSAGSDRVQNAQGALRLALAQHRDLIEGKASHAALVASQERIARLRRQRSTAFATERQRRYRAKNAERIAARRKKRG